MDKIWNPICITKDREFGHSALGYITPCCWNDPIFFSKGLDKSLFTEDLKIVNNDSIEDILLSEAWQTFYNNITSGSETASGVCQKYCNRPASSPVTQIKILNWVKND